MALDPILNPDAPQASPAKLVAQVSLLVSRARAVAASVVTLLSGVAVLVTTFSSDIASLAPEGYADDVTKVSVIVVAWLTTAITALRRVTPVSLEERGVLPQ